jgi:hypothetical protein
LPSSPTRGRYEQIVTTALESDIEAPSDQHEAVRNALRAPEAGDRIALHLARLIQATIETLPDKERVSRGLVLSRRLAGCRTVTTPNRARQELGWSLHRSFASADPVTDCFTSGGYELFNRTLPHPRLQLRSEIDMPRRAIQSQVRRRHLRSRIVP